MYTYFNNLNVTHLVKIYKVITISFIEKIEQNKSNFDNIAKSELKMCLVARCNISENPIL